MSIKRVWPLLATIARVLKFAAVAVIGLFLEGCNLAENESVNSSNPTLSSLDTFAEVRRDPKLGTITFAKNRNLAHSLEGDEEYKELMNRGSYEEMAGYFLNEYNQDLLIDDPNNEFILARVEEDSLGYHQVRFRQVFETLSVIDSELIVHFNDTGNLYLVNGHYAPTPTLTELKPSISISDVEIRIMENLGGNVTIEAAAPSIFQSPDGPSVLAYEVIVSVDLMEGWRIILDAVTGDILRKTPTRYNRK